MDKKVKVGVIGIGNMGSAHASCIASGEIKGMELMAVCDIDESRLAKCEKAFPNATRYADWQELLKNPELDAVVIAVPHPLHAQMAMAALKAGKHVQLEKPVDISVSRAEKLNRVAETAGKVFSITFNQRNNDLFQKAREIVKSGTLGELKRSVWINTNWYRTQCYYDSGTWRATWRGEGGGVLLNQAPHNLDLWQWICGMPSEITGFCDVAKYHNIEVEDDVTIFARYPNGATGTFITTTGEAPGTNRLEISGTKGKMVMENGIIKLWILQENEREVCKTSKENSLLFPCDYEEFSSDIEVASHIGILQNFTNAILYGEELLAPGIEGVNSLMISNAAYLSAWNGSTPVSLPIDNEKFDRKLQERIENSNLKLSEEREKFNTAYQQRWQVNW